MKFCRHVEKMKGKCLVKKVPHETGEGNRGREDEEERLERGKSGCFVLHDQIL